MSLANAGSDGGIKVRGLHHSYIRGPTTVSALEDIDLEIGTGEFISLVGTSGCGKTTLLDLMTGLLDVQKGDVLLNGRPPEAGRPDTARMFARDALLPWRSAAMNVDFALETRLDDKSARASRIDNLLSSVGLSEFADAYPAQLSQGMRQRVALARTFSLQSQFVFLDEPFGAVDALTKVSLQEQLVNLWQQTPETTIVLVTHDLAEAVALSDRVIVLSARPGRVRSDHLIELPRPRDVRALHRDPAYHELVADLWEKLGT